MRPTAPPTRAIVIDHHIIKGFIYIEARRYGLAGAGWKRIPLTGNNLATAPAIGAEVVVEFFDGDPLAPFIRPGSEVPPQDVLGGASEAQEGSESTAPQSSQPSPFTWTAVGGRPESRGTVQIGDAGQVTIKPQSGQPVQHQHDGGGFTALMRGGAAADYAVLCLALLAKMAERDAAYARTQALLNQLIVATASGLGHAVPPDLNPPPTTPTASDIGSGVLRLSAETAV